ncbi:MAG TPA: hypothetical protein VK817_15365 [Trebonia sp.]|nr:hypothetical protein [Trebonia sp.]
MSPTTWQTVPSRLLTSARLIQPGKWPGTFFRTMRWPSMPSGYRPMTSGRSRRYGIIADATFS